MSNPVNAATPPESGNADTVKTVGNQVSDVVKKITTDEDGNYVFPEDVELSPELKFAVTAEKRRRDTQAEFTKTRQTLKASEAEKAKLFEQLRDRTKASLTPEQSEELEDLKYSDPEAWRDKLNKYESESKAKQQEELAGLTGEARKSAELQFEMERRQQVLNEFNESSSTPITDEVIANDVPPRITKKLEEGKITFEDFLSEVTNYLSKGKVIKNEETLNQPSLGKVGGGDTPSNEKVDENLKDSYAKTLF